MFDFRLKVFYTVARRLNFTRASAELFISQPAVTKHIHELEAQFKTTLFERNGNKKIRLTPTGSLLFKYAEQLMATYNELDFEMSQLQNQHTGALRIGGSNTVAQYVIPPVLAQFHNRFNHVKVSLFTANTEQVELAVLNKEIDLGIVEGIHRNSQLKYEAFLNDELVLVCNAANRLVKAEIIKPEQLKTLPLLTREPGSGTLDVIAHALKSQGVAIADLSPVMQLDSSESIKSYLLHSKCFAFLSVQSILNELKAGTLRIIDVKNLNIVRPFYFVQPHGQLPALATSFKHFCTRMKS